MPEKPSKAQGNRHMSDLEVTNKVKLRCVQLKQDITLWMRNFEHKHARTASKTDLKGDKEAYKIYKKYKLYKQREKELFMLANEHGGRQESGTSSSTASAPPPGTPKRLHERHETITETEYVSRQILTPKRRVASENFSTPTAVQASTSTSIVDLETSPSKNTTNAFILPQAVGPTPQTNGRALGIFDLKTPRRLFPEPLSRTQQLPSSPIKDPRHERHENHHQEQEHEHASSSSSPMRPDSDTFNQVQSSPVTTPIKPRTPVFVREVPQTPSSETPGYFKSRSVIPESADSESPIAPRKLSRTISSIVADIQNMSDLSSDDEDAEGLNEGLEDFLGETREPDDEINPENTRKYKKRGAKRSTRRVIMRPADSTDAPAIGKPKENFRRLKLHNSGYKGKVTKPPWKR